MNPNTKIEATDSMIDVMSKLSEGNPGATNVIIQLYKEGSRIDPDDFLKGLGSLLQLDTFGIYGSRIWMLYKDVCGTSLVKMAAVLRAVQLGLLSETTLQHAIDNGGQGVDVDAVHASVRERLPAFSEA